MSDDSALDDALGAQWAALFDRAAAQYPTPDSSVSEAASEQPALSPAEYPTLAYLDQAAADARARNTARRRRDRANARAIKAAQAEMADPTNGSLKQRAADYLRKAQEEEERWQRTLSRPST